MVAAAAPRYEIVCRLAGGGMADLFLARAAGVGGFERLVVVKRLNSQMQSNPAMVQALFDEARIAATLSHANIVAVTDVEVVDGEVSIVMEYLHGHDVSHLVRRLGQAATNVPLDQAIAIALGVLAGLHHAHERVGPDGKSFDIVHRDVSPHNVFVTYDGAVKIIDFGIARATTRRGHTEHGVIKGKPGYIAPEQVRGKTVDRRTDIWSTAVLLYEMTTGSAPFGHGGVAFDQLVAVVTEDPPPPSSREPSYPRELEAIVMKGMSREPVDRYPTAEAMRVELEAFARKRGLDLSPFGLSALMERVFGAQLGAWREAQREGRSLAEHVRALQLSGLHPILGSGFEETEETIPLPDREGSKRLESLESQLAAERAESQPPEGERRTTAPPAPRRLSRRWRIAIGVIAAPLVVIAGMAVWSVVDGNRRSAAATPQPGSEVKMSVEPAPIITPEPTPEAAAADAAEAAPPDAAAAQAAAGRPDSTTDEDVTIDPPQHESPFVAPPKKRVTRPSVHVAHPGPPASSPSRPSGPAHSQPVRAPHPPAQPPAPPDPDAPLPR